MQEIPFGHRLIEPTIALGQFRDAAYFIIRVSEFTVIAGSIFELPAGKGEGRIDVFPIAVVQLMQVVEGMVVVLHAKAHKTFAGGARIVSLLKQKLAGISITKGVALNEEPIGTAQAVYIFVEECLKRKEIEQTIGNDHQAILAVF